MKLKEQKKDIMLNLKATVVLILATAAVVSGVWTFFFVRTSALKDERIALLEKRNAELRELGAVPEAVKRLEERLIPLSLAFPLDPFNGRIKIGTGMESPTEITMLLIKAEELRNARKFDLANARLDEVEGIYPGFAGTPFFRFLIERDKDNTKDALAFAEQAIRKVPSDNRILPAYEFAIKFNLQQQNKKRAEDLCLSAIWLDPTSERWREFFKQAFGYEASIPHETK